MKLTQSDRVFAGLGRSDDNGMTSFEFRKIRNSLGLSRKGMGDMLGCQLSIVRTYENETVGDGNKIDKVHAKHARNIASMTVSKRTSYIETSGYELTDKDKFK